MGRGRAKAKQTKVARRLKYSGGGTDLDRLRRELGTGASAVGDVGCARRGQVENEAGTQVDGEAGTQARGDSAGEPGA